MPLSYFLDLAYDYDKYGISAPDNTEEYLKKWMKLQFGAAFSEEDTDSLADIYNRYTRLVHNRRPEHMSDKVYHPQNYYESYRILKEIEEIEKGCEALESKCPAEYMDSFTQLISYNVLAGMNLVKLWIYRGYNHYYASIGAVIANEYGRLMKEALRRDKELTDRLHTAASGKWYGFGLGAHIGFKNWNQEESANPIVEEVIPVPGAGLMAGLVGETGASAGQDWTGQNTLHKQSRRSALPVPWRFVVNQVFILAFIKILVLTAFVFQKLAILFVKVRCKQLAIFPKVTPCQFATEYITVCHRQASPLFLLC